MGNHQEDQPKDLTGRKAILVEQFPHVQYMCVYIYTYRYIRTEICNYIYIYVHTYIYI